MSEDALSAGSRPRRSRVGEIRARLAAAGVERPDAEAWAMLERVSGRDRLSWLTEPDAGLTVTQQARLDAWIAGRAGGVPLQHLLGVAPFWGLELEAGPDALIPRPETERLVELALTAIEDRDAPRILDLGTGSGAVAIALARERPAAQVWAADVDAAALAVAQRNVDAFAPGVRLLRSDLLEAPEVRALLPGLDLLVANLPYLPDADAATLPPEVRREPPLALFGGPDGLGPFRRAWRRLRERLPLTAEAWFELDPRNVAVAAAEVRADPAAAGRPIEIADDLAGRPRFLRIGRTTEDGRTDRLTACRPAGPARTLASHATTGSTAVRGLPIARRARGCRAGHGGSPCVRSSPCSCSRRRWSPASATPRRWWWRIAPCRPAWTPPTRRTCSRRTSR
ncbi:MAG: peptide chain release factor N(5)-glutamine methyltransferase [Trueperaceae bacterium]|nr:peptide chain release factor N(5)-glutamine methyltransferase [Trueperaceae bacterium]